MRSMLMFGMPIARARPNARVAWAASVRLSRTARARGSKPWTPRLSRLTPPSSQACTLRSSVLAGFASSVTSASGARSAIPRSHALDHVSLASRCFQLAAQQVRGLALVGDQLLDPDTHPILDPRDLPADLFHVGLAAAVALALPPQARVLVAQVRHRPPDPTVQAELVARLGAGHLLPAVPAEDKDGAQVVAAFKSATSAWLSC